jgi:hypothetical protein
VDVAINCTTDTNAPSLQFDLVYAANYLVPGAPIRGNALADQQVYSGEASAGAIRVLMFSLSNSPLTNGVLVYVPFSIATNAPDQDETLVLSNIVVSNPQGSQIPAGSSNGVLSVAVPPQFTSIFTSNQSDIHLQLQGTTGRSYVIAVATNLNAPQWAALTTNVAVNGLVEADDVFALGVPARFYRASFYK